MVDDLDGSRLALLSEPSKRPSQNAAPIAQERAIGRVMHVGLDDRGIDARLEGTRDLLFNGPANNTLMDGRVPASPGTAKQQLKVLKEGTFALSKRVNRR